ncbi:MAG: hypothetical protein WKF75_21535 [Singulisphaera sp.]
MRSLKMKPELIEKYGYPELTDAVKAQIFGLNAPDSSASTERTSRGDKADKLSMFREEYRADPHPSHTQYGWVWVGDDKGEEPTIPIGT